MKLKGHTEQCVQPVETTDRESVKQSDNDRLSD